MPGVPGARGPQRWVLAASALGWLMLLGLWSARRRDHRGGVRPEDGASISLVPVSISRSVERRDGVARRLQTPQRGAPERRQGRVRRPNKLVVLVLAVL